MLLILQSSVLSNMEGEIPAAVDFREEYCAGQAFYAIPGSGRDVPVKAGESLIIVNNAQNHLESNPDSWDATTADFEWYDESSNENFLDTDNPAVPNLDKWYAQTLTVHSLHNRGAYGIAIAMLPQARPANSSCRTTRSATDTTISSTRRTAPTTKCPSRATSFPTSGCSTP